MSELGPLLQFFLDQSNAIIHHSRHFYPQTDTLRLHWPDTDFMGAVYCASVVNFLIFTKQTYMQTCCLLSFSAL